MAIVHPLWRTLLNVQCNYGTALKQNTADAF